MVAGYFKASLIPNIKLFKFSGLEFWVFDSLLY